MYGPYSQESTINHVLLTLWRQGLFATELSLIVVAYSKTDTIEIFAQRYGVFSAGIEDATDFRHGIRFLGIELI